MNSPTAVKIARALFLVVCWAVGTSLALGFEGTSALWYGAIGGAAFGIVIILVDALLTSFTIRGFSSGTFGLMIGLFCAWLFTRIGIFDNPYIQSLENYTKWRQIFELALYSGLGFIGTTLALRSNQEEFSFVIPYVRFRREAVQGQPLLVDTNIIIDGRIPRVCESGFLGGQLIIPRFVVDEMHILADSNDGIKRERGQRGLDCLNQIQQVSGVTVVIHDEYFPAEKHVDTKLIQLAKQLGARLLTNDGNLGKVARLRGVQVLNLNELVKALRPVVIPGDELELNLIKEGKDSHQAVGYLSDGTMIVVNNSVDKIGRTVDVVVSSALQTSAGRLIFAEMKGTPAAANAGKSHSR